MKKILLLLVTPFYTFASIPMRLKKLEEERAKQRRNYFVNITHQNIFKSESKQDQRRPIKINTPIKNVEAIKKDCGFIIVEE